MPIHEFTCKKCGKTFEYLCMRSADKDRPVCPECGHDEAEIRMSSFSTAGAGGAKGAASSCAPSSPFS